MRILAISDLHTQPANLLTSVIAREKPDLVIYAGDAVGRFGIMSDDVYINAAVEALERAKGAIVFSSTPTSSLGHAAKIAPEEMKTFGWGGGIPPARKIDLGPQGVGSVHVIAVPIGATDAKTLDKEQRARMDQNPLAHIGVRRSRLIGETSWSMWVERPKPEQSAGSWSSIASSVPEGVAGVLGNDAHPLDGWLLSQEGCHDLATAPKVVGDTSLLGLPGAPYDEGIPAGSYLYGKSAAQAHLQAQLASSPSDTVVLVSHAPPEGILDTAKAFGPHSAGSSVVRKTMVDPRIKVVICGHVHAQGGKSMQVDGTLVVNVASDARPGSPLTYAVLEIDGDDITCKMGSEYPELGPIHVRGIGPKRAKEMELGGIGTLQAVADTSVFRLSVYMGPTRATVAKAHAQALVTGTPQRMGPTRLPPERERIYIDVETSLDRQDDPWLIGLMLPGRDVEQLQQLKPAGLRQQLRKLNKRILNVPEKTFVQWGTFDRAALAKAYEGVGLEVPGWLHPRHWLDACAWLWSAICLPVSDGRLSTICDYFGIKRRYGALDGATVGLWYTRYRDEGRLFPVDVARAYNADDVVGLMEAVGRASALARCSR